MFEKCNEIFDTLAVPKYPKDLAGLFRCHPWPACPTAKGATPSHTPPFVSYFAIYLQASLNIIIGHADCRWPPSQT